MFYTGIGSRKTPKTILKLFTEVAIYLSKQGYILRSGGAKGADQAFERGAAKKEIYLPWRDFENNKSNLIVGHKKAFEIAEKYHPRWNSLSEGAKKLQARNSHQILGITLNKPSRFVICWTEYGIGNGGTGQAIRIAKDYNIPIFDCGKYNSIQECIIELKSFLKSFE